MNQANPRLVHMIFEQLQQQQGQAPRYVLTGGTLLALLRHGTGAREIDGVLDFVARRSCTEVHL